MSIIQSVIKANLDNIRTYLPENKKNDDSFAFLIFSISSVLDVTLNEAILSSTEGGGDGGIDAIYIDETEDNIIIHIFQTKYRTNLNKGIGKNEIDLTIAKVEEIFQGNEVKNQSEIIKARIDEIRDIIKEKRELKMPEVHVHFAVNTFKPDESEKERAKILESKGNYFVYFYDGNDLLQFIDKTKQKECKMNINTYKDILYLGADKKLGDVKGIVTTVSAVELVKIYENSGRDKVLSRNIRYFLGNNRINKKIKETASSAENAKYFWFLNNGVTIVCDKFSHTDDALGNKIISITNPKIINGGQTTKSLYHLFNDLKLFPEKSLQDVYLLLRLYETDNEELIDKITEGTNSQNPIFERDLKANHPVQLLIKEYFRKKGYFYETHRNEYADKKIDKDKIANNERIFQAYISLFKFMPNEAKSSKSKIFEKYFDNVFVPTDEKLPKHLLISHEILTFIENKAKKNYSEWLNGNVFLTHAELGLVYLIGKICPTLKEEENISSKKDVLTSAYDLSVYILRTIVDCEKMQDFDYSHNKFFKSRDFNNRVDRLIRGKFKEFVDKIIADKQSTPTIDTSELEKRIGVMVYKLYDLAYNEVKEIDPEFWLSEEEYRGFEISG